MVSGWWQVHFKNLILFQQKENRRISPKTAGTRINWRFPVSLFQIRLKTFVCKPTLPCETHTTHRYPHEGKIWHRPEILDQYDFFLQLQSFQESPTALLCSLMAVFQVDVKFFFHRNLLYIGGFVLLSNTDVHHLHKPGAIHSSVDQVTACYTTFWFGLGWNKNGHVQLSF